jgi:hypothetical protein
MSNIYLTWAQLKEKKEAENLTMYYADMIYRWQIFLISGSDAFICYLPKVGIEIIGDSGIQEDAEDFENNYKPNAVETAGVKD